LDIETLLVHLLARRDSSVEAVIRQLHLRHDWRQTCIDRDYHEQQLVCASIKGANVRN